MEWMSPGRRKRRRSRVIWIKGIKNAVPGVEGGKRMDREEWRPGIGRWEWKVKKPTHACIRTYV
jgi:hypothetical protein